MINKIPDSNIREEIKVEISFFSDGTARGKFFEAIKALIHRDIYPGPTVLNLLLHDRYSRTIDGRECKWRDEAFKQYNIKKRFPYNGDGFNDYQEMIW
jgi:hypothetical protein